MSTLIYLQINHCSFHCLKNVEKCRKQTKTKTKEKKSKQVVIALTFEGSKNPKHLH